MTDSRYRAKWLKRHLKWKRRSTEHGVRRRTKMALRREQEPAPSKHRRQVTWEEQ